MEFATLERNQTIPVLGMGTWGMGGRTNRDISADEREKRALAAALDMGITHFDTAEMYGDGHAEELLGEAIRGYPRDSLFITTKVSSSHLRYTDVVTRLEKSLQRLNLDHVDLYLIHWPNPEIPIEETIAAMDETVDRGLAKHFGVSNFSIPELERAQDAARHRIITNQVEYNLLNWREQKDLLEWCRDQGILLTAYEPLAKGRLTRSGIKALDRAAEKYGKTPAQVALNWLINQDGVIAIPKASNLEHIEENLGALGWHMSQEDRRRLEASF